MASPDSDRLSACSPQLNALNLVTCNLHGFSNGRSMLSELCDDPNTFIIAVQEHWLTDNNSHLLNNVHPDFAGYELSAVKAR